MFDFEIFRNHSTELIYLLSFCTVIFGTFRIYFYLSFNKTKIFTKKTYQTVNKITEFKIRSNELSEDNSVYLAQCKNDGWKAILFHVLYGYYVYLKDPTNIFCFFFVAMGQVYEYNDVRSLIPLSVLGTIEMLAHVYATSVLLKQQSAINAARVKKLVYSGGKLVEKIVDQKNIKRGDFIKLSDKDDIPADILLINSRAAVQELELTGEDIVVLKSGVNLKKLDDYDITINHFDNFGSIGASEQEQQILMTDVQNDYFAEPVSTNLSFSDLEISHKIKRVCCQNKEKSTDKLLHDYTTKNMIFRGTRIVDGEIFGIVIETGNDCQIYRIDNSVQKAKTSIQNRIIDICIVNLYLMLIISSFASIIVYNKSISEGYSYQRLWKIVRKMVLLFNTMVPLSMQFFFNAASKIISRILSAKNKVKINRNGTNAFQIIPEFIVSDKTGTITTNEMDVVGIYYEDNNLIDEKIDDKFLLNVISCSEVQSHNTNKTLLKNDILEEKLLTHMLKKLNATLRSNNIDSNGFIEIENVGKFQRLLYKPFDYKTEVKIGVIREGNNIVLHAQGTPESINKYSNDGISKILKKLEDSTAPKNVYKRVIAHASKIINEEQLLLLKDNPEKILSDMSECVVYVFYDYVIKDVEKSIKCLLDDGKDFTLLTGDKMSSAIEIGETIEIIEKHKVIAIDQVGDIETINFSRNFQDYCFVINGRLLEQLAGSSGINKLLNVIIASKKRIVYRASPAGKQIYVAFLQKYFKKECMMIGDGANDVSAIIQANVGVGVKKDNNMNVQNISEIVIDNWNAIPGLLVDMQDKQIIINNIARWVLMKHMITASMLLVTLVMSNFENIRDPASPFLMAILNGSLFVCMCFYSMYDNPKHVGKFVSFWKLVFRGIIVGLVNGIIILSVYDINKGIYILVGVQAIQLIGQLYWKFSDIDIEAKVMFVAMAIAWLIFVIYSL